MYKDKIYKSSEVASFRRNKDKHGELSNMYPSPLVVNGIKIRNSEALYQACKFPDYVYIQLEIINEVSPMSAKRRAREYELSYGKHMRSDWFDVNVDIMRWCLKVKLIHNWETFSSALLRTGDMPIVEDSYKDQFWGAKNQLGQFIGKNILGELLTELREEIKKRGKLVGIKPLDIPNFRLCDKLIRKVVA